ncbi:hypothetical protein M3Y97_00085400 [Aphelenchoides bicaudatus]|nr:hypothetical protein M3Y97_00085400 [Aphelenchoides bicaudatus]
MGRQEGLTDFLTFISPICIIILFFLCLFRFLFSCCNCRLRSLLRRRNQNAGSIETGITTNSMATAPNLNMPSLPLNYIDYESPFFQSPFFITTERFPPKYEDAIKLPNATPRRPSCSALPPPPFDNSSIDGQNEFSQEPPAYYSLSRQGRPTGSAIATISGANTTGNAFLVAIPSPSASVTNAPMELNTALLAEKRLRVGLNAVRHASLSAQHRITSVSHSNRPITSIRTRNLSSNNNQQQRPFTMHTNSRYLPQLVPSLPGQISEATPTQADSEKTGK